MLTVRTSQMAYLTERVKSELRNAVSTTSADRSRSVVGTGTRASGAIGGVDQKVPATGRRVKTNRKRQKSITDSRRSSGTGKAFPHSGRALDPRLRARTVVQGPGNDLVHVPVLSRSSVVPGS